jgi:ribosome-associated heat shock protein Hsp15
VALDRQRIDKWLWHARLTRTRSAAAALAASGHVRLNGALVDAPSRNVKPGDIVTVALDSRVRVLKVLGFALRRGPAEAGRALYEEQALDPPAANQPPTEQLSATGPARSGRPTKRDRRKIDRFTADDGP